MPIDELVYHLVPTLMTLNQWRNSTIRGSPSLS